jgi:hypothetical protein
MLDELRTKHPNQHHCVLSELYNAVMFVSLFPFQVVFISHELIISNMVVRSGAASSSALRMMRLDEMGDKD